MNLYMINYIFNNIPDILLITSIIIFLWFKKFKLLLIFIIGYILNRCFNILLRNTIKDKRLTEYGDAKYNMPSGHSQSVFYSLVFIFLFLWNKNSLHYWILLFYSILCIGTVYTCIIYNYHTIDQAVVGLLIGGMFAFLFYKFVNFKMFSIY